MKDNFAHLGDSQSSALYNIETRYYDEACKCQQAQAYLAGCVMLGAALEASLMAMVTFHPCEVAACKKLRRRQSTTKKLLEWNLNELLDIANELGWLPASGPPYGDPKEWPIGDHTQALRLLRNLVHPGRYVKECPDFEFAAGELSASFKVLHGVYLHLRDALSATVSEAVKRGNP